MRIFKEATLEEVTTGDFVEIAFSELCVTGTVTATNLAQGTLSFVPFACAAPPESGIGFGITWFQQPATIKTIELGKRGVKLSKAVDSEAAVTYTLTWERIAELEPGAAMLLTGIQTERPTEWNWLQVWDRYKERLSELVGWDREGNSNPELGSSVAYNIVYHKLLDCLMDRIPPAIDFDE